MHDEERLENSLKNPSTEKRLRIEWWSRKKEKSTNDLNSKDFSQKWSPAHAKKTSTWIIMSKFNPWPVAKNRKILKSKIYLIHLLFYFILFYFSNLPYTLGNIQWENPNPLENLILSRLIICHKRNKRIKYEENSLAGRASLHG